VYKNIFKKALTKNGMKKIDEFVANIK
jgi:hypothetical protein